MINILCMCYNSEDLLERVLNSWKRIGRINVFIDDRTIDKTREIAIKFGKVEYFKFTDFSESRNKILEKFPHGYRIFIDDSYVLRCSSPENFIKELRQCNKDVVSIKLTKDNETFYYSKITRAPVLYSGKVHEYINFKSQYRITSGFIDELTIKPHIIRTLKRFNWDFEMMVTEWYINPCNYRNLYYLCRGLLFFANYKKVNPHLLRFWLIQVLTFKNSERKEWAKNNLKILDTIKF